MVATLLVIFVLGPHLPPGKGSAQAAGQVTDNTVLTAIMTPIICLIVVYFAYVLIVFRRRGDDTEEGVAIRGNPRVQTLWIAGTSALVIFLAGYGTWALLQSGSGGGQGPAPIAVPRGPKLPVQVIAQQWQFTYRYPTFGGLETSQLVLPADRMIEFHVTSLDAVHSFWAYGLGVKADANLGTDNVVYVKTRAPRSVDIHCAELCGLWHGYMFDKGQIVSSPAFVAWIGQQQKVFRSIAKYMPPYRTSYAPMPQRRAG
ncbi:MAG TPA: cytochrome c oxidase subunit II [Gaiellaceae bacterium]|nr:cytochrome c oxidase subunit II [Gaiellaceae bacterium]